MHQDGDQCRDRNQDGHQEEKGEEGICERVERLMMVSRPENRPVNVSRIRSPYQRFQSAWNTPNARDDKYRTYPCSPTSPPPSLFIGLVEHRTSGGRRAFIVIEARNTPPAFHDWNNCKHWPERGAHVHSTRQYRLAFLWSPGIPSSRSFAKAPTTLHRTDEWNHLIDRMLILDCQVWRKGDKEGKTQCSRFMLRQWRVAEKSMDSASLPSS